MIENSFNFFDKIYCVHDVNNMTNDPIVHNRDINIRKSLKDFDLKFVYADRPHNGYRSTNYNYAGEFGNTLSHLKVLLTAIEDYDGNDNILVFEDDIEVRKSIDANNILGQALQNLPDDWALLYLGGYPESPVLPVKPPLYTVNKFVCCFSYAIRTKYLFELAKYFTNQMGKLFPESVADNIINDYFRHNELPIYCIYPFVITHLEGMSEAKQGYRKHDDIFYEGIWQKRVVK